MAPSWPKTKRAPKCKMPPRRPKMTPECPQERLRLSKMAPGPRWSEECPRMSPSWPEMAQEGAKMAARWPRDGSERIPGMCKREPRHPKITETAKMAPRGGEESPRANTAKESPRQVQGTPKTAQDSPRQLKTRATDSAIQAQDRQAEIGEAAYYSHDKQPIMIPALAFPSADGDILAHLWPF